MLIIEQKEPPKVSMDIPFLIRLLEYAREELKSDVDLHKVVAKMITLDNKLITMKDYSKIKI